MNVNHCNGIFNSDLTVISRFAFFLRLGLNVISETSGAVSLLVFLENRCQVQILSNRLQN